MEMLPSARRIALLTTAVSKPPAEGQAVADLARVLGIKMEAVDIPDPADLASTFMSERAGGVEAINVLSSPTLFAVVPRAGRLA